MKKEQLHTEKEFIDLAWQNMSTLLDQEMPVKKKSRRGFFWLFGIAGSTILIFTWMHWQHSNFSKIDAFPIAQKQSNINNNPSLKTANPSISKDLNLEKNKSIIVNKNPKRSNKSLNETHAVNPIKRLTPTSPSAEVITYPSADASSFVEKREDSYTPIVENKTILTSENTTVILKKEDLQNHTSTLLTAYDLKLTNIEKIPSLKFSISPIPQNTLNQTIPTSPNRLKGKWNFGFYAGMLAPKIKSFNVGIHLRYQLNTRWSFHTGLGYAKRKWQHNQQVATSSTLEMDNSSLPAESEDTMDPAGSYDTTGTNGSTGTTIINTPSGVVTPPISENLTFTDFHYIDLPIFVQYRVTPRWSLSLGGQISRLYGYNYNQQGTTYFSNGSNFDTNDFRSAGNLASGLQFNKWNYSALGGVSFAIHPKLAFYTNYQLGLNSRFKSGNDTSKWIQGTVGIRVYLK